MNNSRKLVRIRIETGRPKRKSGVYVRVLQWGIHAASRQKENGIIVDLEAFQQFQIEEGPDIFYGMKFKLVSCENEHNL